jgi:methyl-accepting chemotaxis protein
MTPGAEQSMGSMTAKSFLLGAFAALALLLLGFAGFNGFGAIAGYRANESFLATNAIEELLLRVAADFSIERGLSNAPLHAPGALSAEKRAEIVGVRARADVAFRDGVGRLRQVPEMAPFLHRIEELERSYGEYETFRLRVDQALAAPFASRPPELVSKFAPAITSLIDRVGTLRTTLEALTQVPDAELARLVELRHLVAVMAEEAGRERFVFGGNIAQRRPFSRDDVRQFSEHRGHIQLVWDAVEAIRQRGDLPASLSGAITGVDEEFMHKLSDLRAAVLARAEDGQYPLSGREWVDRSGVALATILKLADETGNVARGAAETAAARSRWQAAFYLALMIVAFAIAGGGIALMLRRVIRPLVAMTDAVERLAKGDKTVAVPAAERGDEVGRMAAAVLVFKQNLIANEELQTQQAQANEAKMRRAQRLEQVMRGFEAKVGGLVESLATASGEMETTAQSMSSTAEQTNRQAMKVASFAEETSVNVQTVASATEELTSSINEIGRRATASSEIAGRAVSDAKRTDGVAQALAAGAQKIGEVVKLINEIAGQTSLLALNATIEAARAGEAGRGFAVVASEVKLLATQTASATGEIEALIRKIQESSNEAVAAIQGIGGTIDEMDHIAGSIATAVEEQASATQEISRSVQQAARGTEAVSANIVQVKQASAESGAAAGRLLGAASQLSRDSAELRAEVDGFLADVKAA